MAPAARTHEYDQHPDKGSSQNPFVQQQSEVIMIIFVKYVDATFGSVISMRRTLQYHNQLWGRDC